MKHVLLFILIPFFLSAQTITESIESYQKKYYNVFTEDGSTLRMDLVKEYDLTTPDESSYRFLITINSVDTESTGSTASAFFADGLAGSGLSMSFEKLKYGGVAVLYPSNMNDLYQCANSIFSYINSRPASDESKTVTATCSSLGIRLTGEYGKGGTWYYFDAGDATFRMPKSDFIEIVKVLKKSIDYLRPLEYIEPIPKN